MKIHSKDFRVPHHKKIDIKRLPTIVKPFCESKKEYKDLLEQHVAELTSLQQLHYASNLPFSNVLFDGDKMSVCGISSGKCHRGDCHVFGIGSSILPPIDDLALPNSA